MRCAAMQPTFLPWAGYFRLMAEVDQFVFLDNIQLARRSWQTRNRVLSGGAMAWITIPITHAGQEQTIAATRIAEDGRWRNKLCRQLRQGYARHPFAADLRDFLALLEQPALATLAELNIALITHCSAQLAIATPCPLASTLPLRQTDRTKRLIEICEYLGCDTYVSPPGSADYLADDSFVEQTDIQLVFAAYNPPAYAQYGSNDFVSHLSIVDIIANLGWRGAAEYINGPWPNPSPDSPSPSHRQEI